MSGTVTQYGRHRVRHGDVNDGLADLMRGDRAQIMYSDPPWGEGNIKYWSTLNKKMNGVYNIPASLDTFLNSVFGAAAQFVDGFMVVEYGVRWRDMIQERGRAAGFVPHGIVDIIYDSRDLPLDAHLFARPGLEFPPGYGDTFRLTKGYRCTRNAVQPLAELVKRTNPDPIILDPCCGMGYTAQTAVDFGLSFRGNEINEARLAKTIRRISK